MDEIIITKENLLYLQICTTIPPEKKDEIASKVNAMHLCGTTNGWALSEHEFHKPVKCADYPDRWHYILVC